MSRASEFPLLDHISSGIVAVNSDAIIELWNSVMEQWHGIQRGDILGKSLFTVFPELDSDHFREALNTVFTQEKRLLFPASASAPIPCFDSDGNVCAVKTTVLLLKSQNLALFTIEDQNELQMLLNNYRSMAENLKSELEKKSRLEKENERLIGAIDKAAEAIIIISSDGRIDYANEAFHLQTGLNSEQVASTEIESLFAEDQEVLHKHLNEVFRDGNSWQGRLQVNSSRNHHFTASVSIAPIRNDSGEITHAVMIQEDVTQQSDLEERLRRSQKQEALITLVGGIAHDFNNLLAGLVGQSYLAMREVKEMPKTHERLERIQKIAHDASEIVRQLLTFARQGDHEAKSFPLDSFIKEFAKLAQHSVPESIRLRFDLSAGDYPFRGDAEQLQQSLLNMVQNSVEACREQPDGEITLTLRALDLHDDSRLLSRYPVLRHGNFAHISLNDNGTGIAPEHLERIFDPFFTTKDLGSGLGLSIVQGCIRNHHGIIEVESRLQRGTTIHLLLPLKTTKKIEPSDTTSDSLSASILLVDDDPNVLEPTKELLECMGHKVTLAHDGAEAVDIFTDAPDSWDIIITDMVMPRMNGLESARRMREIVPNIPIIFATGYDKSLVINDTRKMSQAILISKPFNPDDLDRMLTNMVLESRRG